MFDQFVGVIVILCVVVCVVYKVLCYFDVNCECLFVFEEVVGYE